MCLSCVIMRVCLNWLQFRFNTHHFLRDHAGTADISICSISRDDQLANIFTKPLDESRFCKLRSEMNLIYLSNVALSQGHMYSHAF
jgi:hypothetical protein